MSCQRCGGRMLAVSSNALGTFYQCDLCTRWSDSTGWTVRTPGQTPLAQFTGPDAERQALEYARRLNYGAMGDGRYDDTWDEMERIA